MYMYTCIYRHVSEVNVDSGSHGAIAGTGIRPSRERSSAGRVNNHPCGGGSLAVGDRSGSACDDVAGPSPVHLSPGNALSDQLECLEF